jgi:hypothetical protein
MAVALKASMSAGQTPARHGTGGGAPSGGGSGRRTRRRRTGRPPPPRGTREPGHRPPCESPAPPPPPGCASAASTGSPRVPPRRVDEREQIRQAQVRHVETHTPCRRATPAAAAHSPAGIGAPRCVRVARHSARRARIVSVAVVRSVGVCAISPSSWLPRADGPTEARTVTSTHAGLPEGHTRSVTAPWPPSIATLAPFATSTATAR